MDDNQMRILEKYTAKIVQTVKVELVQCHLQDQRVLCESRFSYILDHEDPEEQARRLVFEMKRSDNPYALHHFVDALQNSYPFLHRTLYQALKSSPSSSLSSMSSLPSSSSPQCPRANRQRPKLERSDALPLNDLDFPPALDHDLDPDLGTVDQMPASEPFTIANDLCVSDPPDWMNTQPQNIQINVNTPEGTNRNISPNFIARGDCNETIHATPFFPNRPNNLEPNTPNARDNFSTVRDGSEEDNTQVNPDVSVQTLGNHGLYPPYKVHINVDISPVDISPTSTPYSLPFPVNTGISRDYSSLPMNSTRSISLKPRFADTRRSDNTLQSRGQPCENIDLTMAHQDSKETEPHKLLQESLSGPEAIEPIGPFKCGDEMSLHSDTDPNETEYHKRVRESQSGPEAMHPDTDPNETEHQKRVGESQNEPGAMQPVLTDEFTEKLNLDSDQNTETKENEVEVKGKGVRERFSKCSWKRQAIKKGKSQGSKTEGSCEVDSEFGSPRLQPRGNSKQTGSPIQPRAMGSPAQQRTTGSPIQPRVTRSPMQPRATHSPVQPQGSPIQLRTTGSPISHPQINMHTTERMAQMQNPHGAMEHERLQGMGSCDVFYSALQNQVGGLENARLQPSAFHVQPGFQATGIHACGFQNRGIGSQMPGNGLQADGVQLRNSPTNTPPFAGLQSCGYDSVTLQDGYQYHSGISTQRNGSRSPFQCAGVPNNNTHTFTNSAYRAVEETLMLQPQRSELHCVLLKRPTMDSTFGFKYINGRAEDRARWRDDNEYYITDIMPHSIAHQSGQLRKHDTIEMVNGNIITDWDQDQVKHLLNQGLVVKLRLRRYYMAIAGCSRESLFA